MSFGLQRSWTYVFSTEGVFSADLLSVLTAALTSFFISLWSLLGSLVFVLYYCVLLCLKLGTLGLPHVIDVTSAVIVFHRTQLSWWDLLVEFLFITSAITFVVYRKRIATSIRKFEKKFTSSSQLATRAAPHAIFFLVALVLAIVGRKFLSPLSTPTVLPLTTLVLPICTTLFSALSFLQNTAPPSPESLKSTASEGRHKNLLWIVLATYHALATVTAAMPFSSLVVKRFSFPLMREMVLIVALWAQLNSVFIEIVFEVAAPLVRYFADRVPSASLGEERSFLFLSYLKATGLVPTKYDAFLTSLLQEGSSLLIIAIFIFTPGPIAAVGMVVVCLLLPAIRTSITVRAWDSTTDAEVPLIDKSGGAEEPEVNIQIGVFSSGRKVKKSSLVTRSIIAQQRRWLEYWVCVGCVWTSRIYLFPLWPSITMLFCWYLQHGILAGASVILKSVNVRAMSIVNTLTTPRNTHNHVSNTSGSSGGGGGSGGGSVVFHTPPRSAAVAAGGGEEQSERQEDYEIVSGDEEGKGGIGTTAEGVVDDLGVNTPNRKKKN